MPALSDLKIKENLRVSPGKITPEIREKMHWSARSHLVNLTLFQHHPKCPYLSRTLFPIVQLLITLQPAIVLLPDLLSVPMFLNWFIPIALSFYSKLIFLSRRLCPICHQKIIHFLIVHPCTLRRSNLLSLKFQERDLPCTAL